MWDFQLGTVGKVTWRSLPFGSQAVWAQGMGEAEAHMGRAPLLMKAESQALLQERNKTKQ